MKNIGRPRNPNSVNYKLVTSLFGEYISQKDMTKAQLKQYKSCLKAYGKPSRGRPKDINSRSAHAMKLIGKPIGTTFSDLENGSIDQKNYWRACDYLRGNVSTLNLIKNNH